MNRYGLALLILAFTATPLGAAQWQFNGAPIVVEANYQQFPVIVSDGSGGAIFAWEDTRGPDSDVYAQRIDGNGVALWGAGGVAVCAAIGYQGEVKIAADGAGGAVIAWRDYRNGYDFDVYAQRVNASGGVLWTADGVAVCTVYPEQEFLDIAPDGAGGAILSWTDTRAGAHDVFVQRVGAGGSPLWSANGVALTVVAGSFEPRIVPDGSGGAIVTWYTMNSDIRAQKVNAAGAVQWTAGGVVVCGDPNGQREPVLVGDGAGGAVVVWRDNRNQGPSFYDIYAQRLNAAGVTQWTSAGVPLCTATENQQEMTVISDGSAGAIVAWSDRRSDFAGDIYVRRITSTGVQLWTHDGVALCTASGGQGAPALVADGAGGAFVVWQDGRYSWDPDVFAQRVNSFGVPQWIANGAPVSTPVHGQLSPKLVTDATGGALIVWHDWRSGHADIYAQRVDPRHGYWGVPEPEIVSAQDVGSDQGGHVAVLWNASGRDEFGDGAVSFYSVWRSTDFAMMAGLASSAEVFIVSNPDEIAQSFTGHAVWEQPTASGPVYWEWVANQVAVYQDTYSLTAPTRQDSVMGDPALHYFKILAHESEYTPSRVWESLTASGYSVDNLAPPPPAFFTAQRTGSDVSLNWHRVTTPDLRDYAIYRSSAPGVVPGPATFLASLPDSMYVDQNAPATALYYVVTAFDVHGNRSVVSDEVETTGPTGAGDAPSITALTVLQNYPNPFSGQTRFEIGLPAVSEMQLEVYDVKGARVRTVRRERMAPGWRTVAFDGRDDGGRLLPSGVYFCRVTAAGASVTRKIVLAR
jgi:hypothetical protein